jgi:hypothetical protein
MGKDRSGLDRQKPQIEPCWLNCRDDQPALTPG